MIRPSVYREHILSFCVPHLGSLLKPYPILSLMVYSVYGLKIILHVLFVLVSYAFGTNDHVIILTLPPFDCDKICIYDDDGWYLSMYRGKRFLYVCLCVYAHWCDL